MLARVACRWTSRAASPPEYLHAITIEITTLRLQSKVPHFFRTQSGELE